MDCRALPAIPEELASPGPGSRESRRIVGNDIQQAARIRAWPANVPIEPGFERRVPVFLASITGERQQLRAVASKCESLANGMRHHESIHARQPDVEQHDVGAELLDLARAVTPSCTTST